VLINSSRALNRAHCFKGADLNLKGADLNLQARFFEKGVRPGPGDQFLFANYPAGAFNQGRKDVEGAAAEPHRVVVLEQAPERGGRGRTRGCFRPPPLPADQSHPSSNLARFAGLYWRRRHMWLK
jgi:hypothetical protein